MMQTADAIIKMNAARTEADSPFALYEMFSVSIVLLKINEYAGPYVFDTVPETIVIADDDMQRKQSAISKKLTILIALDINMKSTFFFIDILLRIFENIIS